MPFTICVNALSVRSVLQKRENRLNEWQRKNQSDKEHMAQKDEKLFTHSKNMV